MAKGKRYKIKEKKRYSNFVFIYLAIVILMFVNYTFSRFTETTTSTPTMTVAKFTVKVNDKDVAADEPFKLKLSSINKKTQSDKVAPSLEGEYFEIDIDPTGTEVSLDYIFSFDFGGKKVNNRNSEGIKIIGYKINDGEMITQGTVDTEDVDEIQGLIGNRISGSILLNSENEKSPKTAFTKADITNIKIYWEWNEKIVNPNPKTFTDMISVEAVVSQKID